MWASGRMRSVSTSHWWTAAVTSPPVRVDAAGEVGCVVAAGLRGAVGAFLGVVGALDDVTADAG